MDSLPDDQARAVLDVVGRRYAYHIWSALDTPQTVREVCDGRDFPISTTHRQINRLEAAGLVEPTGQTFNDGAARRTATEYVRIHDRLVIAPTDDPDVPVIAAEQTQSPTPEQLMDHWRDHQDDSA